MKNRCYPKYTYIVNFVLSVFCLSLAVASLFINESLPIKIICSVGMLSFSVITLIMALRNMQYFYFADGYLTVKWAFGEIVRLEVSNTVARIEKLITYSSRPRKAYLSKETVSVYDTWICIYDKSIRNRPERRFISGCSNSKKAKRIQRTCKKQKSQSLRKILETPQFSRLRSGGTEKYCRCDIGVSRHCPQQS